MDLPTQMLPFSRSSAIAQRYHFAAIAIELGCVISIGAVATLLALYPGSSDSGVALEVVTLLFVVSMLSRLTYSLARFDTKWYGFRAVSESMKRTSWLYAMRAGDFGVEDSQSATLLRSRLAAIAASHAAKPYASTITDDVNANIPASMVSTRHLDWNSRRAEYLMERLDDQRAWYQRRARSSDLASKALTAVMLAVQVIGIALALRLLQSSAGASSGVPIIAFLVVLVSATVAWQQAKQYSELVGPYTTARSELDQLRAEMESSCDESEFLTSVGRAELSISREHVSWLATHGITPA